ncbi:transmembrane protein 14A (predicted), isoform CRA_c [Rattus norvegicus]|uniref:Transmembrane protein 14A (Predicted), isoform CRA_c n=1 Tax=Rattus norvegicus TaxID=10116 RepID=A6JJ94_RAT|nr:transmembrane protein 14A (predicted), isoform CRA_c [Rattus norvegicus]
MFIRSPCNAFLFNLILDVSICKSQSFVNYDMLVCFDSLCIWKLGAGYFLPLTIPDT